MRLLLAAIILTIAAAAFSPAAGALASDAPVEHAQPTVFQEAADENEDLPWPIFLVGSIAVPAAILLIFSFAVKRGSGEH